LTQVFCDIADLKTINEFSKKKIVKGFTTNPSLFRKAGAKNYQIHSKKIINLSSKKPISLEVFADDPDNMISQALKINSWSKNIYVKIPIVNSKNIFMGRVLKYLVKKNVKLNITAVYNASQTKKILKCVKKDSKVIISIFVGRASDSGKDPIPEIKKSLKMTKKFKHVKILWASVREPYNYIYAKKIGCDIITVPPSIIKKIEKFGKSYSLLTKETVSGFLIDSINSKFKI
tara:strand:- start:40 stop:735 length:696 start_codon:yes stop_codon:yes gene_type:complete